MACSRCGKKASDGFKSATATAADAATRPRPQLRQRPINRPIARQGRFGAPIQPADQPSAPSGD